MVTLYYIICRKKTGMKHICYKQTKNFFFSSKLRLQFHDIAHAWLHTKLHLWINEIYLEIFQLATECYEIINVLIITCSLHFARLFLLSICVIALLLIFSSLLQSILFLFFFGAWVLRRDIFHMCCSFLTYSLSLSLLYPKGWANKYQI